MPESPEQFLARVRAAEDADGRLRVPPMAMWEIFPFEPDALVVTRLQDPVLPEPARGGEGGEPCRRCADPEADAVWADERWVLVAMRETALPFVAMLMPRAHLDLDGLDDTHAADLGRLVVRLSRAVQALPHVGRVHVNKWGDGGSHLHVFVQARPAGFGQLRGSNLSLWEDLLPNAPAEVVAADVRLVAAAMASGGGRALV